VTYVRVAVATTVLAITVIAAPFSALAKAPSGGQVRNAVRRAERSSALWATINICNSRRDHDDFGVRGQMPALGFESSMSMRIHVDWYSPQSKRFLPIHRRSAVRTVPVGRWSKNLQQAGAVFPFRPRAGLLNATVVFTWSRGGRTIGQAEHRTTGGHRDADFGSPPRYSAAQCRIP
jgi:hypothetical protein